MRKSTKIGCSFRLPTEQIEYLEQLKNLIKEKTNVNISTAQVLEAIIEEHKEIISGLHYKP